jgi:UDP-glucose 4-epimerase
MSGTVRAVKALITGGAGFIGSHLAELLLDEGVEVWALDDLSTGSERNVAHLTDRPEFHLVVDSVLSPAVVSELVHRCDVVYHLAAVVGVRLIVEQPGHTLLTNVQGTENVLAYCSRFRKPVLVASSSEVYGDHPEQSSLEEDARRIYGPTTARRWAYADTKAIDEFLALARHDEEGLPCVIARLFNTVGPRQSGQYGNVIPRFVDAALTGRPLEVHGDGTQTRCFCHVSDVVKAMRALMVEPSTAGQVFNVGSTERVRIVELAEQVLRATGSDSEIVFVPYEEVFEHGADEEMHHRAPSIDKIAAAVDWRPTIALEGILEDVIAHLRTTAAASAAASTSAGRPAPESPR